VGKAKRATDARERNYGVGTAQGRLCPPYVFSVIVGYTFRRADAVAASPDCDSDWLKRRSIVLACSTE
jgi:hypothetical protein